MEEEGGEGGKMGIKIEMLQGRPRRLHHEGWRHRRNRVRRSR